MYYVYVLTDPRTAEPFYAGKGFKRRMFYHERVATRNRGNAGNRYLYNKIRKIKSLGLPIIYEKWIESEDEYFCFWMEVVVINFLGRKNLGNGPLLNLSDGGEGVINCIMPRGEEHHFFGKHHTEESNQKNSASHIGMFSGEKHPMFGTHHNEESRGKISKKCLDRVSPNKGKKLSDEHVEKLKISHLGQVAWNKGQKTGRPSPNKGGELAGRAKLKEVDVWAIHDRYHLQKESVAILAGSRDRCGYISNILAGRIWKSVHDRWHLQNPGFVVEKNRDKYSPEALAKRAKKMQEWLDTQTPEELTAKANKTWATRRSK